MYHHDPVVAEEIPVIRKVIANEIWFEGERRGCAVSADDPVVRENVCQVVLRIGHEMRENISRQLAAS